MALLNKSELNLWDKTNFKTLIFLCFGILCFNGCGCSDIWENVEKRELIVAGKKLTLQLKTFNRCHSASGRNFIDQTTNHVSFSAIYGSEEQTFFQSRAKWTTGYLKSQRFWSAIETEVDEDNTLNIIHTGESRYAWSYKVSLSPLTISAVTVPSIR